MEIYQFCYFYCNSVYLDRPHSVYLGFGFWIVVKWLPESTMKFRLLLLFMVPSTLVSLFFLYIHLFFYVLFSPMTLIDKFDLIEYLLREKIMVSFFCFLLKVMGYIRRIVILSIFTIIIFFL